VLHALGKEIVMLRISAIVILGSGLLTAFSVSAQPGRGSSVLLPETDRPLELRAANVAVRVVLVVDGLVSPWDFEFLPDGAILINEMNGRMRIFRDGMLSPEPVWESPSPQSNDVLHGLAVHPDFEENGFVYASYAKALPENPRMLTTALSRGRLVNDKLVDVEEIFVADAWEPASMAIAGRMIFGPDKTLYLTVGDRDHLVLSPDDDTSVRMRSQSLADHVGKTLRLTDDGGVPADNPFVGDPNARGEIFTLGNRNGYGLEFHPETGELWELEIGPMGGDEINILVAGGNYGWPLLSMGRNYTGTLVSDQPWFREGMINPRVFWVPAISPAGFAFYTGDKFPRWQGGLFVTALSGQHVELLSFGQGSQSESRQEFLGEMGLRFRDVEQGPDGYIYLSTEVRYGSPDPEGTIIRLEPAGP